MKPTDDTRAAEQRGYCKGYAAGKKRKQRDISNEARQRKADAFWQRAFLAALPSAFAAEGWSIGGKPVANIRDRVNLAEKVADEALKVAIFRL